MSKNSIDLIGISVSKLNGKKAKAFWGSFFYLLPTLGICAIPYIGWAIGIILFGFITPGYINFMQQLIKGENPSYDIIFRGKGDIVASIFLGIILAGGMIIGTTLAIVPGMFFATYYSMSFFFLNEDQITSSFDSMKKCANNVAGNATNLFAYKVIFYTYYVIITLICAALALTVYKLVSIAWMASWVGIILYVVIALGFILLTSLCTMYFYAANCVFYEEVIAYQEVKKARKAAKKTKIEKEVPEVSKEEKEVPEVSKEEKEVPVKSEEAVVEEKPVKKQAVTKKTTTKSTTGASKTASKTTTKKAPAKKAPVKKTAVKK